MNKKVIAGLKDGSFDRALDEEGSKDYAQVKKLWSQVNSPLLLESQEWINKNFKRAPTREQ